MSLSPTAQALYATKPENAVVTEVASSDTSVTIIASNTSRLGLIITNDSTQILYIRFGTGAASASDFSVEIPADGYYEAPFHYRGAITGIWAAENGAARVTELT